MIWSVRKNHIVKWTVQNSLSQTVNFWLSRQAEPSSGHFDQRPSTLDLTHRLQPAWPNFSLGMMALSALLNVESSQNPRLLIRSLLLKLVSDGFMDIPPE